MEQTTGKHFIIIDDSRMDIFLMEKIIRHTFPESEILSFEHPDKAVAHFRATTPQHRSIVFLDINMPVITGFDFLEIFDTLRPDQKIGYSINIITSSNNLTDIERGKANPNVAKVLQKPLSKDTLINI